MPVSPLDTLLRFGVFELDLQAGQLRKNGSRIRLSQQPIQLLSTLLERPGTVVTREELRQRLWPEDVFVDFDHGLNKAVQKLRDALGDAADSPRYIETIPRIGYRFIAPVSGEARSAVAELPMQSPIALVQAKDPSPRVPEKTDGHPLRWLTVASIAAALAIAVGWGIHRRQRPIGPIHSLAVLPLDNLSGDKEQDYFADGMTDELTTMLAKDSTLRIVSRTSAMQYKGVHRPLREIAQALGVDGVVEGSVERNGDDVHMTLQLIQGASDTHVWAQSYDRGTNDLVSLPDDAAMEIAKRTNSTVTNHAQVRYVNPEAHDAYLHGRYLWYAFKYEEAAKYFNKAVQLQPNYAPAWAGLSSYYAGGMVDGLLDPQTAGAEAVASAQKAVALDDSLPWAHLSLCSAIYFVDWDLARADRECLRAIELDPEFAEAYRLRGKILSTMNRPEEAIAVTKKGMDLDPFARPWFLAYIYVRARQYDAALMEVQQRLESDPHNAASLGILAGIYRCKGMDAEAAKAWEDALIASGNQVEAASLRNAFARGGYRAMLLWNIANMKKQSEKSYVSPVDLALQYAQLGEREPTLSLLEEGYRQHSPQLIEEVQEDPAFDFLHSDGRYQSLIKRIGLPQEY